MCCTPNRTAALTETDPRGPALVAEQSKRRATSRRLRTGSKNHRISGPCEAAGRGFGRDELKFAVAVAHQFGMALEVLEHRSELEQANERLRVRLGGATRLQGNSPRIRELLDQIGRVAPSSSTVLILGDSGTGKELVSQMIHELSPCSVGPFVAVNCAAFPKELLESELFGYERGAFSGASAAGKKGLIEAAASGTLFLDEVGDLSPEAQAKLLRFLEDGEFYKVGGTTLRKVKTRIVSATNRDLEKMIGEE